MNNVIEAQFGKRHLEDDLQPVMDSLVNVFCEHFGQDVGLQLSLGVCASLNNLSDKLEKEINGRTKPENV
tara:strand:- start:4843 stop:5052 length:210 start_codon:yes stop_codon:yes gene_type:complete